MDKQSKSNEFDDFVRACSLKLLRSAYLLTGDQQLAEDLVQTALVRTFRSWNRLDDQNNAEAYTRKVMYHLQVSWWRKRRVKEVLDERDMSRRQTGPDTVDQVTDRLALRQALVRLAPRQRAVIVLRFYEDRSVADTAATLGCSEGTVKSQTAKAIANLRQQNPELARQAERSFA